MFGLVLEGPSGSRAGLLEDFNSRLCVFYFRFRRLNRLRALLEPVIVVECIVGVVRFLDDAALGLYLSAELEPRNCDEVERGAESAKQYEAEDTGKNVADDC